MTTDFMISFLLGLIVSIVVLSPLTYGICILIDNHFRKERSDELRKYLQDIYKGQKNE